MDTSWEKATCWYDKIVGSEGHYYHQHVILPGVLRLLEGAKDVLDLACGQGILARSLPKGVSYSGVDASKSLIKAASKYHCNKDHHFYVADVTGPLPLSSQSFTHGAIILALQNIQEPLAVLNNFQKHLAPGGKLVIVINHPCFRIPRQSSWQVDPDKKLQYRRVDRYFSPLEVPIQTSPGQKGSANTLSFHHPLKQYAAWLKEAGFVMEDLQEWCSDKSSSGKHARMENRSRREFPLFLTLLAAKP